jgi:DNA-binding transcriptional LysR family regulator
VIKKVIKKEIEIGVVGEFVKDKRLKFEKLMEDEVVLIVPRRHRFVKKKSVRLEDLKEEEFIIREEGSGTRKNMEEKLRERGIELEELKIVCELGSTEAIKRGVAANLGISFVSKWAIKEEGICVIPIKGFKIKRFFYLVIHTNRTLSRSSKIFYEFCLKERKSTLE